ncbi:hypothetical protein [Streptomyces sp. NBC_01304]|uniref:hypothetical protein n=1 Tax=Streptomyces sp. NBC_01304 TaxID=2903818 RepID=UPI002E14D71C|nr:hypothetical protein OG430_41835 [Streptomyces sp. NBC_01304]
MEVGGEVIGYAYRWRGDKPLWVGERVLVPKNYFSRIKYGPGPTTGVVTGLGSTYRRPLSFITGRAPESE